MKRTVSSLGEEQAGEEGRGEGEDEPWQPQLFPPVPRDQAEVGTAGLQLGQQQEAVRHLVLPVQPHHSMVHTCSKVSLSKRINYIN